MENKNKKLRDYGWSFWIIGFLAFIWFVLRSGRNPKRLTYPCQQAVYPIASSWLIAILIFLGGSLFLKRFIKFGSVGFIIAALIWFTIALPGDESAKENTNTSINSLPIWEVSNPVSRIFVMDNIPPTSGSLAAGDSTVPNSHLPDPALDSLLLIMQKKNIYLHKTALHPNGIVGSNNVVIIKCNFQWTKRNTTSTDRIKGLIWQILNHPNGFTGEIIVADNTQNIGTGINQNDNNSEDTLQSIINVVNVFRSKHYPVYVRDWVSLWDSVVTEYSSGNYANGFPYDPVTKITYPKFRSPSKNYYISMRYGIWDSLQSSYDTSKLCIIDFPVLKAHSMAGATVSIKNWVGVVTTAYSTQRYGSSTTMHYTYFWGTNALIAKVMHVTFPKLCIVDAAWTTTNGPNNPNAVVNTKVLLASTDPVAVDWYSSKFILTPVATSPNATNPDYVGGTFYNTLRNWTAYLKDSVSRPCTKDSSQISVYSRNILTGIQNEGNIIKDFNLFQNYPNPFNPRTSIKYQVAGIKYVKIVVYDILGKEVAVLVNEKLQSGTYRVNWDASAFPSGVYYYRLTAGVFTETKKMLMLK